MTEDNFVDFNCPYCGDTVSFPGDLPSIIQECPRCAQSLLMPTEGEAVGRRIPLPLSTPEFLLRRLGPGDWKDLLEIYSDEEIFRFMDGYPLDEEAILRWLETDSQTSLTTPHHYFHLGIQDQRSEKMVGLLELLLTENHRQAKLSLVVNRQFQRQGVGTKALAMALNFLFQDLNLHRVYASCDNRNAAACRMLEKSGFRREGEFLKDGLLRGEWVSTTWHAILREEFSKGAPPPAQ